MKNNLITSATIVSVLVLTGTFAMVWIISEGEGEIEIKIELPHKLEIRKSGGQ